MSSGLRSAQRPDSIDSFLPQADTWGRKLTKGTKLPEQATKIPDSVKSQLRREVGFACPVQDCYSPFLTFHHFDPPRHVRDHNEPEGMVALCRQHHDAADNARFTKKQLRSLKSQPVSEANLRRVFPFYPEKQVLVRLAGNYGGGCSSILSVDGDPVVWFSAQENGMFSLSFRLNDQQGNPLVSMDSNTFEWTPQALYDLEVNTSSTLVKVWLAQRKVGMEMRFKVLSLAKLDQLLERDQHEALKHLPEEVAEIMASYSAPVDPALQIVREWVTKNCLDSDGNVTLIDIENLTLCKRGGSIVVRNGRGIGDMLHGCVSLGNGGAAFEL